VRRSRQAADGTRHGTRISDRQAPDLGPRVEGAERMVRDHGHLSPALELPDELAVAPHGPQLKGRPALAAPVVVEPLLDGQCPDQLPRRRIVLGRAAGRHDLEALLLGRNGRVVPRLMPGSEEAGQEPDQQRGCREQCRTE
jgi:hypothetical protein